MNEQMDMALNLEDKEKQVKSGQTDACGYSYHHSPTDTEMLVNDSTLEIFFSLRVDVLKFCFV